VGEDAGFAAGGFGFGFGAGGGAGAGDGSGLGTDTGVAGSSTVVGGGGAASVDVGAVACVAAGTLAAEVATLCAGTGVDAGAGGSSAARWTLASAGPAPTQNRPASPSTTLQPQIDHAVIFCPLLRSNNSLPQKPSAPKSRIGQPRGLSRISTLNALVPAFGRVETDRKISSSLLVM
jgi:hypothetical protein